jgi:hypothetical protein
MKCAAAQSGQLDEAGQTYLEPLAKARQEGPNTEKLKAQHMPQWRAMAKLKVRNKEKQTQD